jgi:hypothetical protein
VISGASWFEGQIVNPNREGRNIRLLAMKSSEMWDMAVVGLLLV